MRKKLYFLLTLTVTVELTLGKSNNITNTSHKNNSKSDSNFNRSKRSFYDDTEKQLWTKDKNVVIANSNYDDRLNSEKNVDRIEIDTPFWGTRGRRDSSSGEDYSDYPLTVGNSKHYKNCKHCYKYLSNPSDENLEFSKERRDEPASPFWGNRGRRSSDEVADYDYISSDSPIGNRDRKQENDPFWGTRGRRLPNSPLRGIRENQKKSVHAENREIHINTPFWSSRGRRDEVEPFWGNRGRREETEPFWGNRGRREESEPFWGNRGRRKESDTISDSRVQKPNLKESLLKAINTLEKDITYLSSLRSNTDLPSDSFWNSRGRESQLKYLFNGERYRYQIPKFINRATSFRFKDKIPTQGSTIRDDRFFVDQPRFILVERSSRSSSEDDPFYISRGKKEFYNYDLIKAARDRRGAIEELVKSVRNDPYYIARGKKDIDHAKMKNSTMLYEELIKTKELICASLDLILSKNEVSKVKREVNDSDRDRRTILKKLAAQLQIDPYFVSRGKKNEGTNTNDEKLVDLINEISTKCH